MSTTTTELIRTCPQGTCLRPLPAPWPFISVRKSAYVSGVAQWLACWAHNPKVPGSRPFAKLRTSRGLARPVGMGGDSVSFVVVRGASAMLAAHHNPPVQQLPSMARLGKCMGRCKGAAMCPTASALNRIHCLVARVGLGLLIALAMRCCAHMTSRGKRGRAVCSPVSLYVCVCVAHAPSRLHAKHKGADLDIPSRYLPSPVAAPGTMAIDIRSQT